MYIGVDIGASKILAGTGQPDGRLHTIKLETPADPRAGVSAIIQAIESLSGSQDLTTIGVAAPGAIDFASGKLLKLPNLSWNGLPLGAKLQQHFKIPVVVENDADAAALAEATFGAGRGRNPVLYVTVSSGIGTGLIIDGHIYHGASDPEGGHITIRPDGPQCGCGGRGHFEALVSGQAIIRRFGRPAFEITDRPTWDLIAEDLALGLSSLIAMSAPAIVVLGGGVSVHWHRFKKPLAEHLRHYGPKLYPQPPVVPAKYIEEAVLRGALLVAQHRHEHHS